MNVLYITGACLTRNTSANMSHNGFIKGLLDNRCKVDILMAKESWGEIDSKLPVWKSARYYEYESVTWLEKLKNNLKKKSDVRSDIQSKSVSGTAELSETRSTNIRQSLRQLVKKLYYAINRPDPIYPLNYKWLKEAKCFSSKTEYDLVVSNSSPAASHKLAAVLLESGNIHCKRWVQIWEDPWYYDLYGGHTEEIKNEEHKLLRVATEVYYVSPLTMYYQKKYFPDCANKMKCVPLPYLSFSSEEKKHRFGDKLSCGYFGDYYSVTRNLKPFYDAVKELSINTYIYGDGDLNLQSTDKIVVEGRVTLDVLAGIQEKTTILVHLCNLKGGQIPGKIYHYSATDKPILFILDGTPEEQKLIYEFFAQYDRYCFCNNDKDSIAKALKKIINEGKKYSVVADFEPKNVVARILSGHSEE